MDRVVDAKLRTEAESWRIGDAREWVDRLAGGQ